MSADELFSVRSSTYGTTRFLLPEEQDGPVRKAVGIQRVNRKADAGEKARALQIVRSKPSGTLITAETLRTDLGDTILESGSFGALLNGFARRGLIVKTGYVPATRPEAHARIIATWRRA
jgi:hypothetical protein